MTARPGPQPSLETPPGLPVRALTEVVEARIDHGSGSGDISTHPQESQQLPAFVPKLSSPNAMAADRCKGKDESYAAHPLADLSSVEARVVMKVVKREEVRIAVAKEEEVKVVVKVVVKVGTGEVVEMVAEVAATAEVPGIEMEEEKTGRMKVEDPEEVNIVGADAQSPIDGEVNEEATLLVARVLTGASETAAALVVAEQVSAEQSERDLKQTEEQQEAGAKKAEEGKGFNAGGEAEDDIRKKAREAEEVEGPEEADAADEATEAEEAKEVEEAKKVEEPVTQASTKTTLPLMAQTAGVMDSCGTEAHMGEEGEVAKQPTMVALAEPMAEATVAERAEEANEVTLAGVLLATEPTPSPVAAKNIAGQATTSDAHAVTSLVKKRQGLNAELTPVIAELSMATVDSPQNIKANKEMPLDSIGGSWRQEPFAEPMTPPTYRSSSLVLIPASASTTAASASAPSSPLSASPEQQSHSASRRRSLLDPAPVEVESPIAKARAKADAMALQAAADAKKEEARMRKWMAVAEATVGAAERSKQAAMTKVREAEAKAKADIKVATAKAAKMVARNQAKVEQAEQAGKRAAKEMEQLEQLRAKAAAKAAHTNEAVQARLYAKEVAQATAKATREASREATRAKKEMEALFSMAREAEMRMKQAEARVAWVQAEAKAADIEADAVAEESLRKVAAGVDTSDRSATVGDCFAPEISRALEMPRAIMDAWHAETEEEDAMAEASKKEAAARMSAREDVASRLELDRHVQQAIHRRRAVRPASTPPQPLLSKRFAPSASWSGQTQLHRPPPRAPHVSKNRQWTPGSAGLSSPPSKQVHSSLPQLSPKSGFTYSSADDWKGWSIRRKPHSG